MTTENRVTTIPNTETFPPVHQCYPPNFVLLESEDDPPWEPNDPRYKTMSLEDNARFKGGSVDTYLNVHRYHGLMNYLVKVIVLVFHARLHFLMQVYNRKDALRGFATTAWKSTNLVIVDLEDKVNVKDGGVDTTTKSPRHFRLPSHPITDQYFTFYNIEPPHRLAMISFHLSGDALSWYKYLFNLVNNNLLTTWDNFTRALETRFGPSSYDNHQATLFKLCQTSTVTAYQTEFERLSNCVVGLSPQALLDCFISGLRHDIQQELTVLRPQTITQAIGLAKLIEDKLHDQTLDRPKPIAYPSPTSQLMPTTQPLLDNPLSHTQSLPIKKLTPVEMQKRRAEGLCYNCPEKYQPGHRCTPPQFLLLQSGNDPVPATKDPPWGLFTVDYDDA
ncbi:transposon ty3-G gag-pol polyprotein [Tanacetum coccineum]